MVCTHAWPALTKTVAGADLSKYPIQTTAAWPAITAVAVAGRGTVAVPDSSNSSITYHRAAERQALLLLNDTCQAP
jgi:hypothetical protein